MYRSIKLCQKSIILEKWPQIMYDSPIIHAKMLISIVLFLPTIVIFVLYFVLTKLCGSNFLCDKNNYVSKEY